MGRKHAPVTLTGNDQLLVSGSGWIRFVSCSETSGSALAHWQLFDGTDATGRLMADVYQPQGTNIFSGLSRGSLGFRNGLFLHKASGAFAGSFGLEMCETIQEWYADSEMYQAIVAAS